MTEHAAKTEQEFLGNAPRVTPVEFPTVEELLTDAQGKDEALAEARQHYVPGAHLRRRPLWKPADDVEVSALIRKCSDSAKTLATAKSKSFDAEVALQAALAEEDAAEEKLRQTELELLAYTRKDTGL